MSIRNAIASLAVADLESAIGWYTRLIGRAPDSRPMIDLAEWKFEGGGWLQLYENADRAGMGSVTLSVSSLDDQLVDLENAGLTGGRQMASEHVKVMMVVDPDGNSIAFAEALAPGIAQ